MKSYCKTLIQICGCKLGDLHSATCCVDSNKALFLFRETLNIFKLHKGPESREVATLLNNIGRNYLDGRYNEALNVYTNALDIWCLCLGNNSVNVAATICIKGQTHHQKGTAGPCNELL